MKLILTLVFLFNGSAAFAESLPDKNSRIVKEFYNLAFNQHKPIEAANKYLAEGYIQHNPHVADGRKGFIDAFKDDKETESSTEYKHIVAQNDLVVLHSHGRANSKDRGYAVVDIFRLKGDKIVEHWDVGQKIPESAQNSNTMF